MRKLLPLLGLLAFAACQPKTGTNNSDTTQTAATDDVHGVQNMPQHFYKQLKGTVAGKPVTMHLLRSGANNISGYYVYDNEGQPIKLYNQQDTTGYLVLLEEGMQDDGGNQLKGKLENGLFTGSWTNGQKTYPFSLEEDKTGGIQFEMIVLSDTSRLHPGDPKTPFAASDVTVLWPTAGAPPATIKMIRDSITSHNGETFTDGKAYATSLLHNFAEENLEEMKDIDTTLERGPGFTQWWSQLTMNVVWNKYPYLVLENFYYEYTGGAHGNGGSLFTCFDLSRNRALRPGDVFKPGYKAVLSKALERAYRKKYNVKDNEQLDEAGYLFNKTIEPNDNFYLTDKAVVFSYTPYEIAAYAAGQINLAVPLADIKEVLK